MVNTQTPLTCQSVIHIKTKALDLLHGQTSVDKHSGGGNNTNTVNKVAPAGADGRLLCTTPRLLEGETRHSSDDKHTCRSRFDAFEHYWFNQR